MRKLFLILLLPFYLFGVNNPYKTLNTDEKLNVMINHFLNLELENIKPPLPQRRELKDDGATLDPVKYELYFSYIQRLKAIKESRAEEQITIEDDYQGKIGFYNGKLKSLKKFYAKKENLYPLLSVSIQKAFKIVFGKPFFSDIKYDSEINMLRANLNSIDIYKIAEFHPKKLELFIYKGIRKDFIQNHKKSNIKVQFTFDGNYLQYKNVLFTFKDNEYVGRFLNDENKIKLNIKINDDIFRPLKNGDKKWKKFLLP